MNSTINSTTSLNTSGVKRKRQDRSPSPTTSSPPHTQGGKKGKNNTSSTSPHKGEKEKSSSPGSADDHSASPNAHDQSENNTSPGGLLADIYAAVAKAKGVPNSGPQVRPESRLDIPTEKHVFGADDRPADWVPPEMVAKDGPARAVTIPEIFDLSMEHQMVTVMVKSVAPFVLVSRPLGSKAKWTLPPLDVYNDYITFLDIYCLERLTDKKHEYLTTINWRSFWNGIGLIGLVTTDLTALGLVRAFIAQHSHDGLEFNTMPKDSNDRRSIVTVILKKDLRSFPAEKLAKVLILRNPGLAGHLTLASITHHGKEEKSRVGHSKDGWRTIEFVGDADFLQSLKHFPDDHLFTMGSMGLHIKGGIRKKLPLSRKKDADPRPSKQSDAFNVSDSSQDNTEHSTPAPGPTQGIRPRPFQAWMHGPPPSHMRRSPSKPRSPSGENNGNGNEYRNPSGSSRAPPTSSREGSRDRLPPSRSTSRDNSFRTPSTSRGGRSAASRKARATARNRSSSNSSKNHTSSAPSRSTAPPPASSASKTHHTRDSSSRREPRSTAKTASPPPRSPSSHSSQGARKKPTQAQRRSMEELHKLIPDFDEHDAEEVKKRRDERVREGERQN